MVVGTISIQMSSYKREQVYLTETAKPMKTWEIIMLTEINKTIVTNKMANYKIILKLKNMERDFFPKYGILRKPWNRRSTTKIFPFL